MAGDRAWFEYYVGGARFTARPVNAAGWTALLAIVLAPQLPLLPLTLWVIARPELTFLIAAYVAFVLPTVFLVLYLLIRAKGRRADLSDPRYAPMSDAEVAGREIWFHYTRTPGRFRSWPVHWKGWLAGAGLVVAVLAPFFVVMPLLGPLWINPLVMLLWMAAVFAVLLPTGIWLVKTKGKRV